MKAKKKFRLGVIRMALSEIKQVEIDERSDITDARCLAILNKMVKQRRDAAQLFTSGKRSDLAENELAEVDVLNEFLPEPLKPSEIDYLIDDAIRVTGVTNQKDMGKVIGQLKVHIQGRADFKEVSKLVKARLS